MEIVTTILWALLALIILILVVLLIFCGSAFIMNSPCRNMRAWRPASKLIGRGSF